jgi:large-conductance mechanosensitive channel
VSQNFSLHENYRDEEPIEAGSDRAFGCTVGSILMVIGAVKGFAAGVLPSIACLIFAVGAVLLLLGVCAPSRLSVLNRIWLKLGAVIARVVNPIVLALLFFFVVTPMALVMRIAGKRPLRLAPDHAASSYWIYRNAPQGDASSMKRQF